MKFNRTRRLRKNQVVRNMIRETSISLDDFIYPLFVLEGTNRKEEISSMKGIYRFSIDKLLEEVEEL
ncbi:MAG TPA: porphobilinogen synthase, partial [Tissierellaceae bacterium]